MAGGAQSATGESCPRGHGLQILESAPLRSAIGVYLDSIGQISQDISSSPIFVFRPLVEEGERADLDTFAPWRIDGDGRIGERRVQREACTSIEGGIVALHQ